LFTDLFGNERLLLAAVGLRLAHPLSGESLAITAEPEPAFAGVIDGLGWKGCYTAGWDKWG